MEDNHRQERTKNRLLWAPRRLVLFMALILHPLAPCCCCQAGTPILQQLQSRLQNQLSADALQRRRGDDFIERQQWAASSSSRSPSYYVNNRYFASAISLRGGAKTSIPNIIAHIKSSKANCWVLLIISIMLEATATTLNKRAADTQSTRLFLSSCILFLMCVAGFNVALSQIDVSVAYALWSALGTVIVSTAGVLFFNESCDAIKLTCIALIIVGVVGLNVRETHG